MDIPKSYFNQLENIFKFYEISNNIKEQWFLKVSKKNVN